MIKFGILNVTSHIIRDFFVLDSIEQMLISMESVSEDTYNSDREAMAVSQLTGLYEYSESE